tara:strand:+ start:3068 stop:3241 length:174 start_codon:yes stop_codon:yes gene_type:complete
MKKMNDVEKKVEQLYKKRRQVNSFTMPVEIKRNTIRTFMMTQPQHLSPLILGMLYPL